MKLYRRLIRAGLDDGKLWTNYGFTLASCGNHKEAVTALRKAVKRRCRSGASLEPAYFESDPRTQTRFENLRSSHSANISPTISAKLNQVLHSGRTCTDFSVRLGASKAFRMAAAS
jgi:hypothetical protein